MSTTSASSLCFLILSAVFSLLMALLPPPASLASFHPFYPTWMVLSWVILGFDRLALLCAWLLGLVLDALYGYLLGTQAMALSLLGYVTARSWKKAVVYTRFQQLCLLWGLLVAYQLLLYGIQAVTQPVLRKLSWQMLSLHPLSSVLICWVFFTHVKRLYSD